MRARAVATALLCAALGATVISQEHVYVTLVEIRFDVTDRAGAFVKALGSEDFTVSDNDRPQAISSLDQQVQAPVSVALILDRSESVGDRFPLVLDSAAAFARSTLRRRGDRGALVAFDSKVYLLQNWTADADALVGAMRGLSAAGGTSLFDALYKTCRDEFDSTDRRENVAVVVTDGEDTTSVATFEDALRMVRLAGAKVYVLGVKAEDSLNSREMQGQGVLARLAEMTGGRVFHPADQGEASLAAVFASLQQELRNGYRLTYYLDVPPDGGFHRVRIQAEVRLADRARTLRLLRAPA